MGRLTTILYFSIALFMLVGCGGNTNLESTADSSESSSVLESVEEDTIETDESSSTSELAELATTDEADTSSEKTVNGTSDSIPSENSDSNVGIIEDKETLSQYSSEQIEYARVWLQLELNQETDQIIVQHIPAGAPVNIYEDASATYPKDVIALSGSYSVDGSVTYNGNGDGTINVYDVPSHWASPAQVDENSMKEYTEDIINNTELVYVEPGDDEKIIELIKILHIDY